MFTFMRQMKGWGYQVEAWKREMKLDNRVCFSV